MGQLHMRRVVSRRDVSLPVGYGSRLYRDGDDVVWTDIMNRSNPKQRTVADSVEEYLGQPHFDPEGCFFVCCGEEPVGSVFVQEVDGKTGTLGMMAVVPEHRGKRLGEYLCSLLFSRLAEEGLGECILTTDDWRIPAIRLYLRVGFDPDICEAGHKERWAKIMEGIR